MNVRWLLGSAALCGAFGATVPIANWMIGHVGTCLPAGPCVIPIGLGLYAPSGVLMVGLALVLRDAIQRLYGSGAVVGAIVGGVWLSFDVAPAALALASAAAFATSELADMAVYTPLARRSLPLAVLASGLIGAVVDSAIFLWLAFGSLDFMAGQVVGKLEISAAVAIGLWLARPRYRRSAAR